jgi:Flp pilus assembly pilin Flp
MKLNSLSTLALTYSSAVRKFARPVFNSWRQFCREEHGQDLIEYSLLIGFVALAAVGLFSPTRLQAKGIWLTLNTALTGAEGAAS